MKHEIRAPRFLKFIASPQGRWLRVLVGAAILRRAAKERGARRFLLSVLGLFPLVGGGTDRTVFGPLLGTSFRGHELRRALQEFI